MAIEGHQHIEARLDRDIQREVIAELEWDPRIRPNEIGVIAKDGVVTLTGSVEAFGQRWAAEEAAHRVRGVTAVLKGAVEWNYQKHDAEEAVRDLWGVRGVRNLIAVRDRPHVEELRNQVEAR